VAGKGTRAKNNLRPILIRNRSFLLSNEGTRQWKLRARVRARGISTRIHTHTHTRTEPGTQWPGEEGIPGADCVSPNQYH